MERIVAVIPARMGSTRFPGKPLAMLNGRPMIEHVYRNASACKLLNGVYVATCDDVIRSSVEGFGGKVIMTSPSHTRASDRVAEAIHWLEERGGESVDIVVMVQGDEPMVTSSMIRSAVMPMLDDSSIACVNLVRQIIDPGEYEDRNTIKVVMNAVCDALYFSRASIPAVNFGSTNQAKVYKQVCVIPFRRDFLRTFAGLAPTPLEAAESIDMLRAIEDGLSVRLIEIDEDTHAVDTPEDLRHVEELMKLCHSNAEVS
jgi:3-deoxy-manno-octulosonate cytidylyltransferase (CMP-KDO synthetase)